MVNCSYDDVVRLGYILNSRGIRTASNPIGMDSILFHCCSRPIVRFSSGPHIGILQW